MLLLLVHQQKGVKKQYSMYLLFWYPSQILAIEAQITVLYRTKLHCLLNIQHKECREWSPHYKQDINKNTLQEICSNFHSNVFSHRYVLVTVELFFEQDISILTLAHHVFDESLTPLTHKTM